MVGKINLTKATVDRTAYLIFLNVLSMSMTTTILSVSINWGGVCIDVLGVASPAVLWGEWCACGPMLLFSVLFPLHKTQVSRKDITLLVMFFTCLLSGFLINLPQPQWLGGLWLGVSCLTYTPFILLPYYFDEEELGCDGSEHLHDEEEEKQQEAVVRRSRRQCHHLSLWFAVLMPLFALSYFLALSRVLQHSHTILLFQFLSLVTKGIYAVLLLDSHLDADGVLQQQLGERSRTSSGRRAFLRYLFQEMLSPLNSLVQGFELFDGSSNLDRRQWESLSAMRGASEAMSGTINDALDLHRLEEGVLQLAMAPFKLLEAVGGAVSAVKGAARACGVTVNFVQRPPGPEEGLEVVGDRPRLEHVLVTLLGRALQSSSKGGVVTLGLYCDPNPNPGPLEPERPLGPGECWLAVEMTVRDEGPGMSEGQQKALFSHLSRTRAGVHRGPHPSLWQARQVLRLHGGDLRAASEHGLGSVLCISIPFRVSASLTGEEKSPITEVSPSPEALEPSPQHRKEPDLCPKPQLLVLEELGSNCQVLGLLLRRCNLGPEEAPVLQAGPQAVHLLLRDPYRHSLLLFTNHTPSLSGLRLVRFIRAGGFRHVLVVLCNEEEEADVADYLSAGADLVLTRPLRTDLVELLLQLLKTSGCLSLRGRCSLSMDPDTHYLRWLPVQ